MTPGDARATVVDALEVVLPGRVQPYPPTTRRYVTPAIFVDQLALVPGAGAVSLSMPVWVVTDGTERSSVAMHDDIVWNAYLALRQIVDRVDARPQQLAGYRATVLTVDVDVDVFTLCAPAPAAAATIPPQLAG